VNFNYVTQNNIELKHHNMETKKDRKVIEINLAICCKILFNIILLAYAPCLFSQSIVKINIVEGMNEKGAIKLSDIVTEVTYIPLETLSNNLISHVDIIKITDEMFIVKASPVGLYLFDRNGKFLREISRNGKGPGEYNLLSSFSANQHNKSFYLYSKMPDQLLLYSFTGEFIKKYDCPQFQTTNEMEFISDNHLLLMFGNPEGKTPYSYMIYDSEYNLVKSAVRPLQYFSNSATESKYEFSFYTSNNKLHVKENMLNDTLYQISSQMEFNPKYVFNSGRYTMPVSYKTQFLDYYKRQDFKYIIMQHVFESAKYLIYSYRFDKKLRYDYFDKTKRKSFTFSSEGIPNDLDGGPVFAPINQKNNELIGFIHAYELKAHIASDAFKNSTPKYPEKKRELERLANSLSESDNPVLMIVKLKE
jgi:hypothetical protein